MSPSYHSHQPIVLTGMMSACPYITRLCKSSGRANLFKTDYATPEAIEQMKAELSEIGGKGVVLYLEGQLDDIEGVGSDSDPYGQAYGSDSDRSDSDPISYSNKEESQPESTPAATRRSAGLFKTPTMDIPDVALTRSERDRQEVVNAIRAHLVP